MKVINNTETLRKSKLALAVAATFFIGSHAMAAEEAITEEKLEGLEVIQVTARKKTESIQDVPMSVNAITGKHIQDMGVHSVEDLSKYVPGLEQPKLAATSRLVLRGVSSGDNVSFEQSVGTYADGVYRGRMNQQRSGFFDMERVEVLKGPQVTLYGNSSIGGALSMITKRPEVGEDITGDITVKYETEYEESQVLGGINVGITDDLAVRVSGKFRDQSEGVAYNNYVDSQDYEPTNSDEAFRIGIVWQPSDDLNVYFRHEQSTAEMEGHNLSLLSHASFDQSYNIIDHPNSPLAGFGLGTDELNIGNSDLFVNGPDGYKNEADETMLEVVWDINDSLTLTSISASSNYDYNHAFDVDIMPVDFIDAGESEDYEQLSQEVRLDIAVSDNIDLMLGLYYQSDETDVQWDIDFNLPTAFVPKLMPGLIEAGLPPEDALQTALMMSPSALDRQNNLTQETDQHAVFTQIDFQATDELSLTLGARYIQVEKTSDQNMRLIDIDHVDRGFGEDKDISWAVGAPAGTLVMPDHLAGYLLLGSTGAPHDFEGLVREEDHLMLQASVRYKFNDDFMMYMNAANGAKSGGFDILYEGDTFGVASREGAEYEDEEVTSFELGLKHDWEDFRLNVAAFYGEYDNLQVSLFNGSAGFNVGNAGMSTQSGIDVELTWQATDNLTVMANAEYLDFTYDEYQGAGCSYSEKVANQKANPDTPWADIKKMSCDWSGRDIPWVPDFKAFVAVEHITEIGDFDITNLLSVSYKTEHTTSSDNEVLTMQDAYALVDYRLNFAPSEGTWHVALTVNNVADEDYDVYTSAVPLQDGAFTHALHKGRQLTLEAGYQF
ncbi:TonB-dependent receptor [Thalassotalea psychrophila]|uniref:TonB-dependent receptor n=1 Tax=Thalassotalea psychrophila TaxID=3065647 RepID=A0ABY9U253_9GAMM|nr:TonB-dependent receptor [Colwelliaceae bacterium SQ149]